MSRTIAFDSKNPQNGFMMPAVVLVFGVCVIILISVFQYVTSITNLTSTVVYRQVALTAARAALEYGKDKFDGDLLYSGTEGEKAMFTNSVYRVTYEFKKLSVNGRSMPAQGIGRVYLPADATTPRYTRTINGEVISSIISAQNPSDFSPLAWYDASCNAATSTDPGCTIDTVLKSGTISAVGNPTSTREERNDGFFCGGAPNTSAPADSTIAMTSAGECGASPTYQQVGFIFNLGSQLPANADAATANLRFTAATANSGAITYEIRGIASANPTNFTNAASAQVTTAPLTTASVLWTPTSWGVGIQYTTPDLTSIIEEITSTNGWVQGNNIGLIIKRSVNTGARRAQPTPITLNITLNDYSPAGDGETVRVWRDRSGNGFHLSAIAPTATNPPKKNTISASPIGTGADGNRVVTIKPNVASPVSTGSGFKADIPLSTGRIANSYTTFAVMRVKDGTDKANGQGTIVGFYGSGTGSSRLLPLWRHPIAGANGHTWDASSNTNENQLCVAKTTTERLCKTYTPNNPGDPGSINSASPAWVMFSSREGVIERDMLLRRNGNNQNFGQPSFYNAITINAPYTLLIGTHASTLSGGFPTAFTATVDADLAEIIVYDHALTCPQVEAIETYLAQKWVLDKTSAPATPSQSLYTSEGCTENNIPAF